MCGNVNQSEVVGDAEVRRMRVAETRDDQMLGWHNVYPLPEITAGEESIFWKTPLHIPGGNLAVPVICPKPRAVRRS